MNGDFDDHRGPDGDSQRPLGGSDPDDLGLRLPFLDGAAFGDDGDVAVGNGPDVAADWFSRCPARHGSSSSVTTAARLSKGGSRAKS